MTSGDVPNGSALASFMGLTGACSFDPGHGRLNFLILWRHKGYMVGIALLCE